MGPEPGQLEMAIHGSNRPATRARQKSQKSWTIYRESCILLELASTAQPTQMVLEEIRGVAQPGSALGSGPRSREFKSPLPDQSF